MDVTAFEKALKKLNAYFAFRDMDVAAFIGTPSNTFSDLKKVKSSKFRDEIKNFDKYFSLYNGYEANIAMSKKVPLIDCIYSQIQNLRLLVIKLAQEQQCQENEEIVLAKLAHLDILSTYFYPNTMRRDYFCDEDEVYYRICDAKKMLKLLAKNPENDEQEKLLNYSISFLEKLEDDIIDKRYENGCFSKEDAAYKLSILENTFFLRAMKGQKELRNITEQLNAKYPYWISHSASTEDSGSLVNFNVVLDETFDPIMFENDCETCLDPKIKSTEMWSTDYQESCNKIDGKKPVYFIFNSCQRYVKVFIDSKISKQKQSDEFKEIVYGEYKRIKKSVDRQCYVFSHTDRELSDHEKREKTIWEKVRSDLKLLEISSPQLEKDGVCKKIRMSLNSVQKKTYGRLYLFE